VFGSTGSPILAHSEFVTQVLDCCLTVPEHREAGHQARGRLVLRAEIFQLIVFHSHCQVGHCRRNDRDAKSRGQVRRPSQQTASQETVVVTRWRQDRTFYRLASCHARWETSWRASREERGECMCFGPGPTIKLRAPTRGPQAGGPLPRTRVRECIGGEQLQSTCRGGGRLGWSGGRWSGASRAPSRAFRSDHPCAGPGRSRSPISPFRGAAGQKSAEISSAEICRGCGSARPKAGWVMVATSR
jgi:hypothetical protein